MESFIWHLSDPAQHIAVRDNFKALQRSSSFVGDENIRRSLKKHRSSGWCESTMNVNENQLTEKKGEFEEGDKKIPQNNENDKVKNEEKMERKQTFIRDTKHMDTDRPDVKVSLSVEM